MIKIFDELGAAIARRWKQAGDGFDAFAQAATPELEAFATGTLADAELLPRLCRTPFLPAQSELAAQPGAATVQVWRNDRFHLELSFRIDPSTAIHDHAFAGAFAVIAGTSLELEYNWQASQPIAPGIEAGDLSIATRRLLGPGDVRRLGPDMIHSVVHLGLPTMLVLARTTGARPAANIFVEETGTRIAPRRDDQVLQRKLQLAQLVGRLDGEAARAATAALAEWGSRHVAAAFELARVAADTGTPEWIAAELATAIAREHDIDAGFLAATVTQRQRENRLVRALHHVRDHGQRLLLALLFSPLSRADIFSLLAETYPERDLPALVFEWLRELLREQPTAPLGITLNAEELVVLEETLRADQTGLRDEHTSRSRLPPAELVMFREALRSWPVLSRLFK